MGVYIKGMEMPKNCYECLVRNQGFSGDGMKCGKTGSVLSWRDGHRKRMDNCPLSPVPPHGRLIDADATEIYKREELALARYNENQDDEFLEGVKDGWHEAAKCLSCAPTIIEADRLPVLHGTFAASSKEEGTRRLTGEGE